MCDPRGVIFFKILSDGIFMVHKMAMHCLLFVYATNIGMCIASFPCYVYLLTIVDTGQWESFCGHLEIISQFYYFNLSIHRENIVTFILNYRIIESLSSEPHHRAGHIIRL